MYNRQCIEIAVISGATATLVARQIGHTFVHGTPDFRRLPGVPQGAVLSPVLSNLYLNPLDHLMADEGFEMVRYADDFVVLCRSQEEAKAALQGIRTWVEEAGLTLHPEKTKIVDSRVESFAFLGYSFRGDRIYPRLESLKKVKTRITELTPRNRSGSLAMIVQELNRTLRDWFGYFRHCRWTIFGDLDARIRRRLRRLLLKRHRTNPERLSRTHRWPNAYFAKVGLYSLQEAHIRFAQSVNNSPESRVRENRTHGSEGGGTELNQSFLPLSRNFTL